MKKNILYFFLVVFAYQAIQSQSISLFDIDKSAYPNIKAKFYSFDKAGTQIKHQKSELSILENGVNRSIVKVDCPPGPPQKSLSSVLVMDVSFSMYHAFGLMHSQEQIMNVQSQASVIIIMLIKISLQTKVLC